MSYWIIALCVYALVAIAVFLYIGYSAVFWKGGHDKLIPYYFGVVLDLSGWMALAIQAVIFALLWLPISVWLGYMHLSMKREMKKFAKSLPTGKCKTK